MVVCFFVFQLPVWFYYCCEFLSEYCCELKFSHLTSFSTGRGHWNLLILCHLGEDSQSKTRTPCMLLLDSLHLANPKRLEPEIRRWIQYSIASILLSRACWLTIWTSQSVTFIRYCGIFGDMYCSCDPGLYWTFIKLREIQIQKRWRWYHGCHYYCRRWHMA